MSAPETTLAQVVAGMLPTADSWGLFADQYLQALGSPAQRERADGGRRYRLGRSSRLSEWHSMLRERLEHGEYADRIDVLAQHSGLVEPN